MHLFTKVFIVSAPRCNLSKPGSVIVVVSNIEELRMKRLCHEPRKNENRRKNDERK